VSSSAPNLTISNTTQPGCNQNNGSITAQASGGQSPYQFRLNGGAFQSNGTFSNLGAGSYTITVRDANGCEATQSVNLQNPAGGLAAASITGGDIELCVGASRNITANLPSGTIGRWIADSDAISFGDNNNRITSIFASKPGIYTLTWTLSALGCANYSSASIELTVLSEPAANDDGLFTIPKDTIMNLLVLDNDRFDGNIKLSIIIPPTQGIVQVMTGSAIQLQTLSEATGEDRLTYRICLQQCPNLCDTAIVRWTIEEEEGICNLEKIDPRVIFPEGITPNGDGYNEALEFKIVDKIGCPTNYAQSDISIFNRWGDRVFYQEPYENGWNGTTNDGKKLPPGVYYYTLRVRRSGKKDYVRFGNVTIFRQ
jgi:gliding motility-associated-like protein